VGDFHEDDYYYLNNGDGTFLKAKKSILGIPAGFLWVLRSRYHDGFDISP
jgi:hypothetical protein